MIFRILKRIIMFFVGLLIILGIIWYFTRNKDYSDGKDLEWGVTLSTFYADELGVDWKEVLQGALLELQVKKFRVPMYWQEIETEEGKYNFRDTEYILNEIAKNNGEVILVVGRRQPRWPECHTPAWLSGKTEAEIEEHILQLLKEEVNHFKDSPILRAWQVENEPLFSLFGKCPRPDEDFLKKEIELVRSQSSLPIILTDSGELSLWLRTSSLADTLGTTLYRVVWNPVWGFWKYDFVPPFFYWGKARLVSIIYPKLDQIIISELQAEPWVPEKYGSIVKMPIEEQKSAWSSERFEESLDFAKRTGFTEAYLWGMEWWYWMKEKQNDDTYWNIAKELFSQENNEIKVKETQKNISAIESETGTILDLPATEKQMGLTRILAFLKDGSLSGMEGIIGFFKERVSPFLGQIFDR